MKLIKQNINKNKNQKVKMKYSVVLALFLGQISSIKIENRLALSKDHHDDDK
jgi:hypothetical protein